MRLRSMFAVALLAFAVTGCGDNGNPLDDVLGGDVDYDVLNPDAVTGELRVETIVSANEVAVGDEVTVECRAAGEGSTGVETTWEVTGGETYTKDGDKLVFSAAGDYQVKCAIVGKLVSDETPEQITVVNGAVAKIVTQLADDEIVAGNSTTVTCVSTDKYGNELSIETVVVVPADLSIAGATISGTKAGVYKVECQPKEAVEGVKLESADLKVLADVASGLQLSLVPAKANYKVGNQVKVGFTLVDKYGNPVAGGAITEPTVSPVEGITELEADPFQFQFGAEGVYTFSACVVDDPAKCDTIEAYCDGTAPLLVIEYPERAAMLQGDRTIVVTGTVHDDVGGLEELTINGSLVSVQDDNTFEFPMTAVQGLNIIDAVATDVFGQKVRSMRSYLFSDVYYPAIPEDTKLSLIPDAARVYLDDKLLDNDADAADTATIAAIAEEVFSTIDLVAMLPNPLVQQKVLLCDYLVTIKSITYDRPTVNAYFYSENGGGIAIDVVIPNFAGVGRIEGENWSCIKDDFTMSADKLLINIGINLSVDQATHQLKISSRGTEVEFENLDINIGWTVDWLLGMLNSTITDVLKATINDQVDGIINDLQADANEAIGEPIAIPIDGFIPGMANMVLYATVQPERTDFVPEGGQIDVSLAVTADKHVDRENIPGSIGRGACLTGVPEVFEFDKVNPGKINAAVNNDIISQAAFALWYTGGLKINLTAEAAAEMGLDLAKYGFADLVAQIDALLPPIIHTCGRENLVAQLGDAYLEVNTSNFFGRPLDMHAFLYAELEVELTVQQNLDGTQTLFLQILEPNRLDLNIVEINEEWRGDEQTLIDTITGLIPSLIADPFDIQIPSFNLADLGGESVKLPNLDLFIVIQQIEQILGHTFLEAGLRIAPGAETPPPPLP
ncbi:MAG TPA: hypothetical protein PLY68_01560 [Myxococcota bacterium]|nr:hypothetical protein [Myxococcota bacterium]HQP94864.1 hypothetical protein [Myxococcota bacterium]